MMIGLEINYRVILAVNIIKLKRRDDYGSNMNANRKKRKKAISNYEL